MEQRVRRSRYDYTPSFKLTMVARVERGELRCRQAMLQLRHAQEKASLFEAEAGAAEPEQPLYRRLPWNTDLLRYFFAVAEELHLARAADRLAWILHAPPIEGPQAVAARLWTCWGRSCGFTRGYRSRADALGPYCPYPKRHAIRSGELPPRNLIARSGHTSECALGRSLS